MFKVSRRLKDFSAAHRLNKSYPGKCRTLHGHTYRVEVELAAKSLDRYDFVIDFSDIKRLFDDWVQSHWDHVTLVSELDEPLLNFLEAELQDYFVLPDKRNTTCEALAEFLFQKFEALLIDFLDENLSGIRLVRVSVAESPLSTASFGCF
jgi:6-pyruvoyltetrahydropterin/6-carboxytetrahydropterin synthase